MPRFGDVVIAPGFSGMVSNGFGVIFYVSNTTNPTENQGAPGPGPAGRSPRGPFTTIQAAINAAVAGRGDVIVIQRGTYTETLAINKAGLTLMGAVPYGYPDHVIVTGRSVVTANGVSGYNLEFFSNSTTAASLVVGTAVTEAVGSWWENCSFASDGITEPACGALVSGGNDHAFVNCRFIDNGRGLIIHSGITSFASGLQVRECQFLENTTVDLGDGASGDTTLGGLGESGGVRNLVCVRNTFGGGVTIPTDFVNFAGTSNGYMGQNLFASATNASATITVPAGILIGPNGTEAGWSTARPA